MDWYSTVPTALAASMGVKSIKLPNKDITQY